MGCSNPVRLQRIFMKLHKRIELGMKNGSMMKGFGFLKKQKQNKKDIAVLRDIGEDLSRVYLVRSRDIRCHEMFVYGIWIQEQNLFLYIKTYVLDKSYIVHIQLNEGRVQVSIVCACLVGQM